MHEHRNDGLRVQREKLWSGLLAAKDIDDVPGPREAFFFSAKRTFAAHAEEP